MVRTPTWREVFELSRTVILGIGNVLLTDDGAGVHAARVLAGALGGRSDVEVVDAGTLSFTLAPSSPARGG